MGQKKCLKGEPVRRRYGEVDGVIWDGEAGEQPIIIFSHCLNLDGEQGGSKKATWGDIPEWRCLDLHLHQPIYLMPCLIVISCSVKYRSTCIKQINFALRTMSLSSYRSFMYFSASPLKAQLSTRMFKGQTWKRCRVGRFASCPHWLRQSWDAFAILTDNKPNFRPFLTAIGSLLEVFELHPDSCRSSPLLHFLVMSGYHIQ